MTVWWTGISICHNYAWHISRRCVISCDDAYSESFCTVAVTVLPFLTKSSPDACTGKSLGTELGSPLSPRPLFPVMPVLISVVTEQEGGVVWTSSKPFLGFHEPNSLDSSYVYVRSIIFVLIFLIFSGKNLPGNWETSNFLFADMTCFTMIFCSNIVYLLQN